MAKAQRVLNTGSDQDSLTAEETAALGAMEADKTPVETPETKPAAAAPAPKAAEQPQPKTGEGDDGKSKTVPHAAFHEERENRKKLEAELKAEREARLKDQAERAKLEERTAAILERLVPKPPEEKVPDFAEDPAGWIAYKMKKDGQTLEQVQAELAGIKKEKADTDAANKKLTEQQTFVKSITDFAIAQEKDFISKTPDYLAASEFLLKSRMDELADMGWSEEQSKQIINQERFAIAQKAMQDGKNPAEMVYNVSKRRGFVAPKPADKGGAGKQPAPVVEDDATKLARVKVGQEISQSLTDVSGDGANAPMTSQRLAQLSDAEFARFLAKFPGQARELMGA